MTDLDKQIVGQIRESLNEAIKKKLESANNLVNQHHGGLPHDDLLEGIRQMVKQGSELAASNEKLRAALEDLYALHAELKWPTPDAKYAVIAHAAHALALPPADALSAVKLEAFTAGLDACISPDCDPNSPLTLREQIIARYQQSLAGEGGEG